MAKAILRITGPDGSRDVTLKPKGMTLGRGAECGIVLDDTHVSRRHARIYLDPLGRWIIEDLGGRHGVWTAGRRIATEVLVSGQEVLIHPFSLAFLEEVERQIEPDPAVTTTTTIILGDTGEGMAGASEGALGTLSGNSLRNLNAVMDRLGVLTSPAQLYPEVCRCLGGTRERRALFLRLSTGGKRELPEPVVLARSLEGEPPEAGTVVRKEVCLSCRLLEAVRTSRQAVLASNVHGLLAQVGLTVDELRCPHSALAVPVAESPDTLDVLYLDAPADELGRDALDFAQAVARQVGLSRKSLFLAQAITERETIERELQVARKILQRMVPKVPEGIAGLDMALCYRPAMWVGGDYCDLCALDDGRLAFCVGDVAGHGLAAALVMANLQASLRATLAFCSDPAEIIARVNSQMRLSLPEDMFVTLFLGVLDHGTGSLRYANAGHIPPLVMAPGGRITSLDEPSSMPLGLKQPIVNSGQQDLPADTGLVLVTDGVVEARDAAEEMFGMERLRRVLQSAAGLRAETIIQQLVTTVDEFRGDVPPGDDMSVLVLCRGSSPASPDA